jgi:hypothetical protein
VVPLLVSEATTEGMLELYRSDPSVLVWWGTMVEVASAISRLERGGGLRAAEASAALARWDALGEERSEVSPTQRVRESARRFLRVHDLRAADALQLGAAFVAAEGVPSSLALVTLDSRLAEAALREGFEVVPRLVE